MSTRRPADPVQVVHVSAALLREWTESYPAPGGAIDEAKDELKRLVKLARECDDSDRVHVLADLACVGERGVGASGRGLPRSGDVAPCRAKAGVAGGAAEAPRGRCVMNDMALNYSGPQAPTAYLCSQCGAHGVKLWRQYQTLACFVELLCRPCALKDQGSEDDPDDILVHSDSIGGLVPAIPTEDGETYWGYTSVPLDGVLWWHRLQGKANATSASAAEQRRTCVERHLHNVRRYPDIYSAEAREMLENELALMGRGEQQQQEVEP